MTKGYDELHGLLYKVLIYQLSVSFLSEVMFVDCIKVYTFAALQFHIKNMKRILGLLITTIGILLIGSFFIFTPNHAFNPADSVSGVQASAGIVYGGFITFGVGMVIFISTLPFAGEKSKNA